MPEYPDITVYLEHLRRLLQGQVLERVRLISPFVLRSFDPPLESIENKTVTGFKRIGKRLVFQFEGDLFLVLHLMIAGRLRWYKKGSKVPAKIGLAAFDFAGGTLVLTEAGTQRRASMNLVKGREELDRLDPGGIDVFDASLEEFRERLFAENHTLKRALTDPQLFSGIGNAYSDEILHRACLSPVQMTKRMEEEQIKRLFDATRSVLLEWTDRLRRESGDRFPEKVTAFHKDMAAHGRFGKACPVCGTPIRRIRYAQNETNYCSKCQTGGKILADRALSRLLKQDWRG